MAICLTHNQMYNPNYERCPYCPSPPVLTIGTNSTIWPPTEQRPMDLCSTDPQAETPPPTSKENNPA